MHIVIPVFLKKSMWICFKKARLKGNKPKYLIVLKMKNKALKWFSLHGEIRAHSLLSSVLFSEEQTTFISRKNTMLLFKEKIQITKINREHYDALSANVENCVYSRVY